MNKLLDKNTYSLSEVSSSEIGDMQGTINSLLEENKEKFLRISNVDPSFSHTLYKPSNPVGIKKIFLKPLMLKQIDNLMDESDILIKK